MERVRIRAGEHCIASTEEGDAYVVDFGRCVVLGRLLGNAIRHSSSLGEAVCLVERDIPQEEKEAIERSFFSVATLRRN
ncbi:hypothetical protein HY995_03360 [Candidatus Micrarchaeota archaeon]|nr:hypothetical protein [Candidatus Micrarchaeota archaeon]